ncbi:hypothetical protein LTR53_019603, partial [Teratosphaeriaceae sp. CCFEE 6253]
MDATSENEEHPSDHELSDEDEDEDELLELERSKQNDGGFAPNTAAFDAKAMPPPRLPASQRRTTAPTRTAVVDRLSLQRSSSSSENAMGRTAWAAPATGSEFKAPSLLRRATTSANAGANDRGVTTGNSASLSRENSGTETKMGGSRKSSLA